MSKELSTQYWKDVLVQQAHSCRGDVGDKIQRTAMAVLDECSDEEYHENILLQISTLAPHEMDMDSKLRLCFLLLHLLVEQGKFPLQRDFEKEEREAKENMAGLIDALRAIRESSSQYVPSGSDSLPSEPAPLDHKITKLKLKKGKRVRFNQVSEVVGASKKGEALEDIIQTDSLQPPKLVLKKNCRYYICGEVLDRKDFETLNHPGWLNDKVINAYLAVLQREQNLKDTDHIFAMPSYMAVLWGHGNGKIDHWLYSDVKFAMFKWVFMPANVRGNHWVLLVANIQNATVSVLDSMCGNNEALIEKWMKYMTIRSERTGELGQKSWQIGDLVSSKQRDGNACGSFVMLNALVLAKNGDLKDVSHPLSLQMREYVKSKLLSVSEEPPSQRTKCDMIGCVSPRRATWVACNVCGRWSHLPCVGLRKAPNSDYICPICVAQYR
ncbi:uncharacterized protein LOC117320720 [Pecten maximus]|uniref:uncharacterized protein LOC117320720 n=1 Tax=Pecten maximus TaxID=6579 RepID=UPI00145903D1|nr:uncharacterized protein LOC117320720 [Pecten maximus]